jgi:Putative beta-barrel porin-2, OmpL-like. bbp2
MIKIAAFYFGFKARFTLVFLPALIFACISHAQTLIGTSDSTKIVLQGYADVYYTYDFDNPASKNRPDFLVSHNRHNEFNLNNFCLHTEIDNPNYRALIAFHSGTYVNANYASEPTLYRFIKDAVAGIKISKNLWLDAGIFASHIGFEDEFSGDNWTLTRTILAENTPYFETGAKLSWDPNPKYTIKALILNGWQNIHENNNNKALGTQVNYHPNNTITLNWSTFYGNEKPDSAKQYRYFNNLYAVYQKGKIGIIAGLDFGWEQKKPGISGYNNWQAASLITRYQINTLWAVAFREEIYRDLNGVLIMGHNGASGVNLQGTSFNIDFSPGKNVWLRTEFKTYTNPDAIFETTPSGSFIKTNSSVCTSLALKF